MALPKAACSSVKAALTTIDSDVSVSQAEISANPEIVHTIYPTQRFRPHRWREYEDWWRFAIVRDPLARLLSAYTDRVVGRRELHNSRKLRNQDVHSVDPDPDYFFQNLREYMHLASAVKHHALPARLFIGPRPFNYDALYKTSEISELERKLSEITGQDVKVPRFNVSSAKLSFEDLAPETRDFLRGFLAEDYELLEDFFENPML